MARILVIYSTTDGHTRKISQRLQQIIEARPDGHQVELVSIEESSSVDLERFDKVVIGASIRYGKHNPKVHEFIHRNKVILESKPNAFFSVNAVARKPGKNQPETNPYLRKFLARISWRPRELAVFAGSINYGKYSYWDKQMIRFIMWITHGPTAPDTNVEFTDWRQVERFARLISKI